ncbi:MAG TPA: antibiotic biosynthesis monooxygenase [Candidatus Dormibacteraeota bacterium]|jgi:quinol monooxygenase YgiN|nr:antibiotic biosynthesis monooxygenase [Candidatus Dormibacteraeota bacterium]
MYGSVARVKLQPGKAAEVARLMEELGQPKGSRGVTVYRADSDPDTIWIAGMFESKEVYQRSSDSPEQQARFERLRSLTAGDPEWHDGEVIFHRFD